MTENEMLGWHHRLYGHEFEQASGVGDGQGSLACCSPQGHKELDTTEQMNNSSKGFVLWNSHRLESLFNHLMIEQPWISYTEFPCLYYIYLT